MKPRVPSAEPQSRVFGRDLPPVVRTRRLSAQYDPDDLGCQMSIFVHHPGILRAMVVESSPVTWQLSSDPVVQCLDAVRLLERDQAAALYIMLMTAFDYLAMNGCTFSSLTGNDIWVDAHGRSLLQTPARLRRLDDDRVPAPLLTRCVEIIAERCTDHDLLKRMQQCNEALLAGAGLGRALGAVIDHTDEGRLPLHPVAAPPTNHDRVARLSRGSRFSKRHRGQWIWLAELLQSVQGRVLKMSKIVAQAQHLLEHRAARVHQQPQKASRRHIGPALLAGSLIAVAAVICIVVPS